MEIDPNKCGRLDMKGDFDVPKPSPSPDTFTGAVMNLSFAMRHLFWVSVKASGLDRFCEYLERFLEKIRWKKH